MAARERPRRWVVETRAARTTRRLARLLGAVLAPGSVLALVGDLGAGKTTFIQGLAEGLGVGDLGQVLSPTYTLVNEYPAARMPLVHIDFYRLQDADAARALGIEEQLARADAAVAVEWADHLPELIPSSAVWLRFAWLEPRLRRIEVEGIEAPRGVRVKGC